MNYYQIGCRVGLVGTAPDANALALARQEALRKNPNLDADNQKQVNSFLGLLDSGFYDDNYSVISYGLDGWKESHPKNDSAGRLQAYSDYGDATQDHRVEYAAIYMAGDKEPLEEYHAEIPESVTEATRTDVAFEDDPSTDADESETLPGLLIKSPTSKPKPKPKPKAKASWSESFILAAVSGLAGLMLIILLKKG